MDKLGKLIYNKPSLLYYYKGTVECPPLQMVDDILGIQKCSPKSLQLNTTVNTFMELEKLTLSKSKCHKIHIGRANKDCPDLKVHGETMKDSKSEKYLGDIIHKSGSSKPNIARRLARGWGKVNEILAIVKEAPLGKWRIKAGLQLRKALLINGTLFNSEAWHGITLGQVKAFEKVDEALLKGLVLGHSKIPIPALYMETAQLPLRFILACRRILFLQTILHRGPEELIRKVYEAQKMNPTIGDFCLLVKEDCILIKLQITEEEMTAMTRYELKVEVKKVAKEAAIDYLKEIKETKTKMDRIEYTGLFDLQPYMQSSLFDEKMVSLLLALRTRTVRGIRCDFGGMFPDKSCPLENCSLPDSLSHILVCRELVGAIQSSSVEYRDVFSADVQLQWEATLHYSRLLEAREKMLERPGSAEAL